MENVVFICVRLVYFMVIWYNLWPFVKVCGHFGILFPYWYFWTKKKTGRPCGVAQLSSHLPDEQKPRFESRQGERFIGKHSTAVVNIDLT
jgi:hypothetical protein